MPPTDPTRSARRLYENEVVRHVLALREALIRHDENLKAWRLMDECLPYFIRHHPDITAARGRSLMQVRHLLEPKAYESYYGDNPHEQPFEEQTSGLITVADAHRVPRVAWLKERLKLRFKTVPPRLLDLGCNDGWMLAHLALDGTIDPDHSAGIDLALDCLTRARQRLPAAGFYLGFVEDAPQLVDHLQRQPDGGMDAVSCFEVMEHVLDPMKVVEAASRCLKPKGWFYFSTPDGAVEMGDIPSWDHVEPKGHVRTVEAVDIRGWITPAPFDYASMTIARSADGLLLTEVQRKA